MPQYIQDAKFKPPTRRHPRSGRIERIPATARNKHGVKRWVLMLRSSGQSARVVLTTAAGEIFPQGAYRDKIYGERTKLGWFPFGNCPLAHVAMGEIKPKHLDSVTLSGKIPQKWIDAKVKSGDLKPFWLEEDLTQSCKPGLSNDDYPCPHALWEEEVRTKRNGEVERARALAWKTEEQKLLDEERKHQSAILEGLLETVKGLAQSMTKEEE